MRSVRSVLVTGGAGFIGTHLLRRLAPVAARAMVFDNLHPQVHGPDAAVPVLPPHVAFVRGDICDREALRAAVAAADPDLIVHLAAETGTGQSYDEVSRYADVNVMGTAHLIEAIRALDPAVTRRIVLASSRAVYGEGAYRDEAGAVVSPMPRSPTDMAAGRFVPADADGHPLHAIPTPEAATARPSSIYASTKLMQEFLLEQAFAGSTVEVAVLRFQNVYGEGQSLRNPYTGVLSIFAGIAAGGRRLDIFEDGEIVRDFVHVGDVVAAILAAATVDPVPVGAINIGTGTRLSILDAARLLLRAMGLPEDRLDVTGRFRAGDVRHAVADIARARNLLGWEPAIPFETGIAALVASLDAAGVAQ